MAWTRINQNGNVRHISKIAINDNGVVRNISYGWYSDGVNTRLVFKGAGWVIGNGFYFFDWVQQLEETLGSSVLSSGPTAGGRGYTNGNWELILAPGVSLPNTPNYDSTHSVKYVFNITNAGTAAENVTINGESGNQVTGGQSTMNGFVYGVTEVEPIENNINSAGFPHVPQWGNTGGFGGDTFSWQVPTAANNPVVSYIGGGGGGGGGGPYGGSNDSQSGGGGGGGGFIENQGAAAGNTYHITLGTGGTNGRNGHGVSNAGRQGQAGGTTTVDGFAGAGGGGGGGYPQTAGGGGNPGGAAGGAGAPGNNAGTGTNGAAAGGAVFRGAGGAGGTGDHRYAGANGGGGGGGFDAGGEGGGSNPSGRTGTRGSGGGGAAGEYSGGSGGTGYVLFTWG